MNTSYRVMGRAERILAPGHHIQIPEEAIGSAISSIFLRCASGTARCSGLPCKSCLHKAVAELIVIELQMARQAVGHHFVHVDRNSQPRSRAACNRCWRLHRGLQENGSSTRNPVARFAAMIAGDFIRKLHTPATTLRRPRRPPASDTRDRLPPWRRIFSTWGTNENVVSAAAAKPKPLISEEETMLLQYSCGGPEGRACPKRSRRRKCEPRETDQERS